MFRTLLLSLFFCTFVNAADNQDSPQEPKAPPPPLTAELQKQYKTASAAIKATEIKMKKMETNWGKTQSEVNRDLIQQQASVDINLLAKQINDTIKQLQASPATIDAPKRIVDLVHAENRFFEQRLTFASTDLQNLFAKYEHATIDQQVLTIFNIDDFYHYINILMVEREKNLKLLQSMGIDVTDQEDELNQEITLYADFMASFLRSNARQNSLLQDELKTLPADARSTLEAKAASQNRLVQSAVANLKDVVMIMEDQDLPVEQYNELLFKTTGNLAEAVFNLDTMKAVVAGLWVDLTAWLKSNISSMLSRVILFVLLMIGAVLLARLVRLLISRAVTHKKAGFSTLVQDFFIKVGGNIVIIFGVLFSLAQIGWDLTPVLTGLGVAGIVIGFALQDTLSNFASGMMILIYRPFDVGDFVEAGGVAGKVGKMSLVNTTIRTFDNQVFMVPNAKIWGETIKNMTAERIRRVDMVFGVAYGDQIERVETILCDIVTSHPSTLKTPEPMIKVHVLNESSVDFIVRPWVKTDDYWDVYWDITREVKIRFDREGVTIPFPQRELHFHGSEDTNKNKDGNGTGSFPSGDVNIA
ncbi:mechanosensitive ion channel domain-containing protein [Endozoicomonas ascidiicola]|uniref:mechanosensitive ion channel domain-containing protein n=1 Tax=Endozoicomonas ascidiicola TaxID=1698521 RepID=UPI000A3F1801|nr:mechanosensitive ion channel domain-containing protein [Endozoicomonas ascidiicola]